MDKNDLVYWDGAYSNTKVDPQPISIRETRQIPLIQNPGEFKVCVDGFYMDSTNWPIFVATPQSTAIDTLIYYVQLKWSGLTFTAFLDYTGYSANTWNRPTSAAAGNSISHQPYYSIYSFATFITIVNDALSTAFTALLASAYPTKDASPPYVTLDVTSGTLALVYPQSMALNNATFVFEDELMGKLGLPYTSIVRDNSVAATPNIAHELDPTFSQFGYVRTSRDFLSTTTLALQYPTTAFWAFPAFYIPSEHDFRAGWYDVAQILIVSNLAEAESVSTAASRPTTQGNNLNVLASYHLDLMGTDHINGQILYSPQLRKWVSLLPSTAISEISISFMYADRAGNVYPILQNLGRLATIRLLFQKITHESQVDYNEKKRKRL